MSGFIWPLVGLVGAFGVGYGLGYTRGTNQSAAERGRLRAVVQTLQERSDALSEALIRAKAAPISVDDAGSILLGIADPDPDAG